MNQSWFPPMMLTCMACWKRLLVIFISFNIIFFRFKAHRARRAHIEKEGKERNLKTKQDN
jgi:uncharacterized protein YpmS